MSGLEVDTLLPVWDTWYVILECNMEWKLGNIQHFYLKLTYKHTVCNLSN